MLGAQRLLKTLRECCCIAILSDYIMFAICPVSVHWRLDLLF